MIEAHWNSHIIDRLFSEGSFIEKYIEVEGTLALVQGNLGLIPKEAAIAINNSLSAESIDLEEYQDDFRKIGFPIVGLIKQLNHLVPDNHGEYLHWGATTQDIMDTGLVLLLKDFIQLYQPQLSRLISHLATTTKKYAATPMIGRSQLQQAIPITFGYKTATWLAPFIRHGQRLNALLTRLLRVQFGGAVGTLASTGEIGLEVRKELANRLGLTDPEISWHTQRDTLAEFMTFLGVVSGSMSKIGEDVLLMTQSEVGEIIEKGGGKSSTMPNKRNPIKTQNVLLAGKFIRAQMQAVLDSTAQEHERGSATWQMEWSLIPNICSQSYFAIVALNELLEDIEIRVDRMSANLRAAGDTIYAEAIMMRLATEAGRQKAHDLVDEAVDKSLKGMPFRQALTASEEILEHLSENEIDDLLLGKQQINMAKMMAEQVLESLET